jgi:hypothetical protein
LFHQKTRKVKLNEQLNFIYAGATLTNVAAGTITITADVSSLGGGTIGNAGQLIKSGTTGTTLWTRRSSIPAL